MLLLRVKAAIMRLVVLLDTACNFNAVILNQSIFNCLITAWYIYSIPNPVCPEPSNCGWPQIMVGQWTE